MRSPLVSVVVPSHNHARFVSTTLRSVAAQTYPRIELIVTDDGSSDESPAIIETELERLEDRFERVVYTRRARPGGMERTFNEAIHASRGKFVCPLASDNAFLPHKVEHVIGARAWEDRRTGAVFSDAEFMDADGARVCLDASGDIADCSSETYSSFIAFHRQTRPPEMDLELGTYPDLLVGNYVSASAGAFRRKALVAIGGYDESILISDWDLLLRLASGGWRMPFIDGVVSRYRRHPTNTFAVRRRDLTRSHGCVLAAQRPVARDLGYGELWGLVADAMVQVLEREQIDASELAAAIDGAAVS